MKLLFAILTLTIFGAFGVVSQEAPAAREPNAKPTQQDKTAELNKKEAVEFAEKFIKRNGYTDVPADKENLSYESIEWESNIDEMLRGRYNTLESKAYGILEKRKGGKKGWTVAFRYKNLSGKDGRAVTFDPDGGNARVEHVDIILARVSKL